MSMFESKVTTDKRSHFTAQLHVPYLHFALIKSLTVKSLLRILITPFNVSVSVSVSVCVTLLCNTYMIYQSYLDCVTGIHGEHFPATCLRFRLVSDT